MNNPNLVLGLPQIDEEHQQIAAMFAALSTTDIDVLTGQVAALETAIAAHFAGEHTLMASRDFPGLHCHKAQHAGLEYELHRAHGMLKKRQLDKVIRHLTVIMPQLMIAHITTMDRMTVAFLNGELGTADFAQLRLPEENAPAGARVE
ncbi:MAG: hypothetical protein EPO23_07900 [Xanthobacteraceae bacterium]|nr:MAG: hypothetical protein EPO23_07900 [Xanthobacteraceae bacterium]